MTQIVTDPDFATLGQEDSRWAILVHEGIVMTPSVKDSVLTLDISRTKGANWHGELRYAPFPVEAGETYSLTFACRAKHPFTFSVWLGQRDEPWAGLVAKETHFGEALMPSDWKTFSHTWLANTDEPNARLNFVLGQIDNVVEIRDVALTRISG